MPAIGFGMLWSGYTLLFWGFCKIKGYDIGLKEIVVPKAFKGTWPPPLVNDSGSSTSPGVKPGDHPGDMPGTWGNDPNYGGEISDPSSGTSSGGGVMNV
jgi:hypothetical protein